MSEPVPPPTPPEPDRPYVVPYAPPGRAGLPVGVQALLGTLATLMVITATVICAGFAAASTGSNAGVGAVLLAAGVVILVVSLTTARRLRRDPAKLGWAIGIYIGLGLGGLFWGFCGVVLLNLNGI